MNGIKEAVLLFFGMFGSAIAYLLGGWDTSIATLVLFMAIDYATGLIVAGVFKKSGKTQNGALESRAGWKGLCKKTVTLLLVLISVRLDLIIETNFIRNTVVIGFIANELLSIIENVGLMGVPIPKAIKKAIEILNKKDDI